MESRIGKRYSTIDCYSSLTLLEYRPDRDVNFLYTYKTTQKTFSLQQCGSDKKAWLEGEGLSAKAHFLVHFIRRGNDKRSRTGQALLCSGK